MDDIAERAVQLGGVAEGTARMVAKRSSLREYPANGMDGHSHVDALSAALAAFGTAARKAIDQANELGALDTADVFTKISRGIDKWLLDGGGTCQTLRELQWNRPPRQANVLNLQRTDTPRAIRLLPLHASV